MKKFFHYMYAAYCYLVAAIALLAFFLFLENMYLEKTVSLPVNTVTANAIFSNIGLLLLFGFQHSIMARDWFKEWLTGYFSPALERVTYVLMSGVALALIVWWWQPFGNTVWDVRATWTGWILQGIGLIGGLISAISAGLINSRSFIGLEQIEVQSGADNYKFVTPLFYKYIRHPIYFGVILLIWCVPIMSASGVFFSGGMTVYMILGAILEEKNLIKRFGDQYRAYQQKVPMLIPFTKW